MVKIKDFTLASKNLGAWSTEDISPAIYRQAKYNQSWISPVMNIASHEYRQSWISPGKISPEIYLLDSYSIIKYKRVERLQTTRVEVLEVSRARLPSAVIYERYTSDIRAIHERSATTLPFPKGAEGFAMGLREGSEVRGNRDIETNTSNDRDSRIRCEYDERLRYEISTRTSRTTVTILRVLVFSERSQKEYE